MKAIYFALPGNEKLMAALASRENAEVGVAEVRQFPDGETYVRILSEVKNKQVRLVCTLHEPDDKLLSLYFFSQTAKSMEAASVILIAPYLAYMRQDKVFKAGEGITSKYFAQLISSFADGLVTIDPHLHRVSSLGQIYTIPTKVAHAANHISNWIKDTIVQPILIGPDSESEQWVAEVAKNANAAYVVLQKIRHGDRDVEVSLPQVEKYLDCTPVLVDDIISTGRTMIETIGHLKKLRMKPPVCIGVHAVFAGDAYQELKNAGAKEIITCNTIPHESNVIDISDLLDVKL